MVTKEQLAWTREALERLYDLAFLESHIMSPTVREYYTSARAAQSSLIKVIQQLKPPANVPLNSMAWRIYNALNERYLSGLTQSEAAVELNISLRQLRRDQMRGIAAVASLLFSAAQAKPAGASLPASSERPQYSLTNVEEALRSAIAILEPLLNQRGLQVSIHMDGPAPSIIGDRMMMRQLLILSLNWIILRAQHTKLEAHIKSAGLQVYVKLLTAGFPGPRDELDAIRHLAQSIGATVQASDHSSELQIAFPACVRRCILMIDDDQDAIELVRRSLETTNEFELVAITHPENALREALELRPDCILLDVMMPTLDGWELLAQFKSHPELLAIPVIISSVLGGETLARALGASGVLPRPYTTASLLQTLRSVITYPGNMG